MHFEMIIVQDESRRFPLLHGLIIQKITVLKKPIQNELLSVHLSVTSHSYSEFSVRPGIGHHFYPVPFSFSPFLPLAFYLPQFLCLSLPHLFCLTCAVS